MHYVSGHEVAQNLTNEVYQLAFTNKKDAWKKRKSEVGEIFFCHVGGMIAYKVDACFPCSPEMMLHILVERQNEWDLNTEEVKILEEYDKAHQILLLTMNLPLVNKIARLCLFRCISINQSKREYFVVYQSIDHDQIPGDGLVLTCAPSGYFIFPVEGDPNRCRVVNVLQFHPDDVENPQILDNYCSSAERITYNLLAATTRICAEVTTDNWDNAIFSARKELYNSFHDVNESNGWSLRLHFTGVSLYTRQTVQGDYVATVRGAFAMPYPTDAITNSLFEALQDISLWDAYVRPAQTEHINENAYLIRLSYSDLSEGRSDLQISLLVCRNIIKENYCDITYKMFCDTLPKSMGCVPGAMPSCGLLIGPTPNGTSVVQWISQTGHPTIHSDSYLRRIAARVINHINSLHNFVSKKLRQGELESEYPVCKRTPGAYVSTMDTFSDLLMREDTNAYPRMDPVRRGKKRKAGASLGLIGVDDMVLKNPKTQQVCAKPFLFLVPDSLDGPRRFVQRRRGSPLSHSNFDMLPQELLLEIFSFMDSYSLANISQTCTHFKDIVTNTQLWRTLFMRRFGTVCGRVARRYAGDDDPATFFTPSFPEWKELFLEQQYIEAAWEAPTRRALTFEVTKAHARSVRSMALLPARHRLVTGSQDRLVRVWDVRSGTCLVALQGSASCMCVSPWSDTVVKLGYRDGVVRLFDVTTEELSGEMSFGQPMRGCVFSRGRTITWTENGGAHLWDENTQQCVTTFNGHTKRIKSAVLNERESVLYTASRDATVKLWDVHNGERIANIEGHTKAVNGISIISEYHCVSTSSDFTAQVWDIRKPSATLHVMEHQNKVRCLGYTELGKKLCTGGDDGAYLWRSDDFTLIRKEEDTDPIISIVMDEESIAFGSDNGRLKFYDFTPHR